MERERLTTMRVLTNEEIRRAWDGAAGYVEFAHRVEAMVLERSAKDGMGGDKGGATATGYDAPESVRGIPSPVAGMRSEQIRHPSDPPKDGMGGGGAADTEADKRPSSTRPRHPSDPPDAQCPNCGEVGKHDADCGEDAPEYSACPHNREKVCAECEQVIRGGNAATAGTPGALKTPPTSGQSVAMGGAHPAANAQTVDEIERLAHHGLKLNEVLGNQAVAAAQHEALDFLYGHKPWQDKHDPDDLSRANGVAKVIRELAALARRLVKERFGEHTLAQEWQGRAEVAEFARDELIKRSHDCNVAEKERDRWRDECRSTREQRNDAEELLVLRTKERDEARRLHDSHCPGVTSRFGKCAPGWRAADHE